MKLVWLRILLCLLVSGNVLVYAESIDEQDKVEPAQIENTLSVQSPQAGWTFAGIVSNENGERYNYFFQIERNYSRFYGMATLINAQTKAVILYEESNTLIEQPEKTHWQVGNLFLRFNPINNSWVFGVKNKGKKGFNFKVDMFGLPENHLAKQQHLRNGVELLIGQTGRLNGHLLADEDGKEQFVTAKKAWFKQLWVSLPQQASHPVTSVLCEFNDGSAFYSVNLQETDALKGAITGWRDMGGVPVAMSQFVSVRAEKDGVWEINIPTPKMTLSILDVLDKINENHELVAGAVNGVPAGFCTISQNEIDQQPVVETAPAKTS